MRNDRQGKLLNQDGFTLAELVVAMAIFVVVMIMTSKAFDKIVVGGGVQSKTATGEIAGMVGLEMFRRDLAHAGYGLPWSFKVPPTSAFQEVSTSPAPNLGVDPTSLNLKTPISLQVVTAGATSTNPGTDYLVIRSVMLPHSSTNSAVGRWAYLNYSTSAAGTPSSRIHNVDDPSAADTNVRSGIDRVTTIAATVNASGQQDRQLLNASDTEFFNTPDSTFVAPQKYQPVDSSVSYIVYAIADRDPKMPWNRADFYVNRPGPADANFKMPETCNPGTGILFKAVANHAGGYIKPYPLLDCVADMKVIYTLDPLGDGTPSYAPAANSPLSPQDLRSQLKIVTLYVLVQEGRMDKNYVYPSDSIFVGPMVGSVPLASVGKTWTGAQMSAQFPNWKNYRWKVYAIPVTPNNMQQ